MNKKLLTLAIAGALVPFALPVTAMAGVTVSGYAHVSVDSLNNGANSAVTQNQGGSYVSSNASNIVISGDTDIGDGLKALFSAQTFLSLGSDNNPPPGNLAGFNYDQFSNGNTYAGIEGGFGTVAAGRNDSPMKQLGRAVDLFGNEIGDSRNIISGPGGYGFDQRPGHTLFYVSPDMGGVTVKAAYTLENSDVNGAGASGTPTQIPTHKGSESSVSAVYSQGIVLAGLAYEYHSASIYGTNNAESALRAAGAINFDPVRITALYQHDSNVEGVSADSINVWGLGAAYTFIPTYAVKVQYYRSDSYATGNNGAGMVAVGLTHTFSKNAEAYLDYAQTKNQRASAFNAFAGGHGNNINGGAYSDPHGVSLGMIYTF
ncbi:MAG: porin [Acidiferrobacterales bacterium]